MVKTKVTMPCPKCKKEINVKIKRTGGFYYIDKPGQLWNARGEGFKKKAKKAVKKKAKKR